jgi:hypothetical protein
MAQTEETDNAFFMHEVVFLNENNVQPKKLECNQLEPDVWCLDNGDSNHMTGNRSFFSERMKA